MASVCKWLLGAAFFGWLLIAKIAGAVEPTPPDPVISDPEAMTAKSEVVFRRLFFSTEYNSLKCQDNIYRFIVRLQRANLDLRQVNVIFIFDKEHYQLLPSDRYGVQRPDFAVYKTRHVATREPPPNRFRYHVFATLFNRVFDFDYTDSPAVEPAVDYFNNMYTDASMSLREKRKLFDQLTLRIIPATDYLKDHPQHPSYYMFDLDERYPAWTLNAYMKSISEKPSESESENASGETESAELPVSYQNDIQ